MIPEAYRADVEAILSHRHDNGADLWATPDTNLLKGAPFTTLECPLYLLELGMSPEDPLLEGVGRLILTAWRPDGRIKVYPKGALYPCHTALAAQTLCHLGWAADDRVQKTIAYLLDIQEADGGWRCNKFSFGRGPETECSNPHPTLIALDVLRFADRQDTGAAQDAAVEFLLAHWTIRRPIGPCHYGIGTLFMQVEYPFRNYNLFEYVYILSYFPRARADSRFQEALAALRARTVDGQIVVQRNVPKLSALAFCKKGRPSEAATRRYAEILERTGES